MIRKDIKTCSVFLEFSEAEQKRFFSVTGKKVIHNVDTLYYGVSFFERDIGCNVEELISDLRVLRDSAEPEDDQPKMFMGFEYFNCSFAHYRHCLKIKDSYDIFIAEYLPNSNTPRFIVQLRSIALWSDGDKVSVEKSFNSLLPIMEHYGLKLKLVRENRIDWAFHTNCIQKSDSYFTDNMLLKHLSSDLTKYQKVGNIGKDITIEYLSLGKRQSNNVFFRCYNKTREVIEMGYKSIFIDIWYKNKLISYYDKCVLERAFIYGSKTGWDSAIAIGKIDWYLENGHDANTKAYLANLRDTYLVSGSNNKFLSEELSIILPDVTCIMNFEFQTKRRYYRMMEKSLTDLFEPKKYNYSPLHWIFSILDNRKLFLDKLTLDTVRFVRHRDDSKNQVLEDNSFLDFWKRIRSCKVPVDSDGELYRTYARNIDKLRATKGIADKVATLSVLNRFDDDTEFKSDLADALCYFNDNDVSTILAVSADGELIDDFSFDNYDILKGRKKRQYKFLSEQQKTTPVVSSQDKPFPKG